MDAPQNTNNESLVADTRGSDFAMPTYEIAAEDTALAAEIQSFDPVHDTKGPTQLVGAVRLPASIKASGLPPHLRDPIMAQLANVPVNRREAEEQRLVAAALYQNSYEVRVAAGPGEGANAYQRETFQLELERYEAEREIDRLGNLLGEVSDTANVVTDPATGQQRVETSHRIQGQQRQAMEAEFRRAVDRLAHLNGAEADRRLKKALFDAVADRKAMQAKVAEQREAKELGAKFARDERVNRIAEAYAKRERTAL